MRTVKQVLDEAHTMVADAHVSSTMPAVREFALALTAIEDAQMRYTRGRAMEEGKFAPADLDA